MTPGDHPPAPLPAGDQAVVQGEFSLRHAGYLPVPPEELTNRLGVGREAGETEWREAYAQRRALYAQRTGSDQPKPVRLKNLALLKQLEALQPALEAHLRAHHLWRLLGEACDYLQARQVGRCRNRLKEAAGLLEQLPLSTLRQWYEDIEADVADKDVGAAPVGKPEAPAAAPARPPPMVVAPAEASAIEGGVVACAVAVWPKEAVVEVGGLPAGLIFDAARGQIAGIPTSPGEFTIVITAGDSSGQSSARILLHVAPRSPPPEQRMPIPPVAAAAPAAPPPAVVSKKEESMPMVGAPVPPPPLEVPPAAPVAAPPPVVPRSATPPPVAPVAVPTPPVGPLPPTPLPVMPASAEPSPVVPPAPPRAASAAASSPPVAPPTPSGAPPAARPPAAAPPVEVAKAAAPPKEIAKAAAAVSPPPAVQPAAPPPVPSAAAGIPVWPAGSSASIAPFGTMPRGGARGAASRPVPGVLLQLLPQPAGGPGPQPGPPVHFVARPKFTLGRRLASVDFVACFFPDNPENRQKTETISRVNTTLSLKGNQILLQDGEILADGKSKASTNGTILDGQAVTAVVPVDFTKECRLKLGQSGYELAVVQLPAVAPGGPLTPLAATMSTQPTLVLPQRPLGCLRFRPVSCREVRVMAVWMFSEAVVGSGAQSAVVLEGPGVPPLAVRFHHWREGFWLEVPVEGKSVITLDGRLRAAGDVVPLQALHQLRIADLGFEVRVI